MHASAASPTGTPASAFSLLELVLVVAIIAVLAAIASPRYAHAASRYRVEMAARRIARDLALARQRARLLGASQTVHFDPPTGTYQIAGLKDPDGSSANYTVDISGHLYGASLISADFGGDTTVVFDGYGTPDSGGSTVVRIGDLSRTVVLEGEVGRATVQ